MVGNSKVDGIGGVFFKAQDQDCLSEFYRRHFGIELGKWLMQNAGPSVVAAFKPDTKYFGPEENRFMINFRVSNLEDLMAGLRADDVTELGYDEDEYGRFFRFLDVEGNAVELWQPPDGDLPEE